MSAESIDADSAPLPVRSKPSPLGRPREYSEEDARAIIDAVANGSTLLQAAQSLQIPLGSVRNWQERDPSFEAALSRARVKSADGLAEQIVAIADDPATGASHEEVGRARLRIESRKWLASKLKPQVYGDKVELSGDMTINIAIKRYTPATIDAETVDQSGDKSA